MFRNTDGRSILSLPWTSVSFLLACEDLRSFAYPSLTHNLKQKSIRFDFFDALRPCIPQKVYFSLLFPLDVSMHFLVFFWRLPFRVTSG